MKIKYIDNRSVWFPYLTNYKNGITLPKEDNIIEVTENEAKGLMTMKNGIKNCWEYIKPERKKYEETTNLEA